MAWLIWRDVTTILRTPAFWAAMAARVALLSAFLVVWATGVPVTQGGSVHEQFMSLDGVVLAGLLTWTAARCALPRQPHAIAALALTVASAPSRIVLARSAALCVTLAACAASGLPLYVLLRQIAALSWMDVASAFGSVLALAVLAASVTTAAAIVFERRIAVWLASAMTMVLAVVLAPPLGFVAVAVVVGAAALAWLAARAADTRARYASDRPLAPSGIPR